MKSTNEILDGLRSLNVEIWVDGEQLRCSAPEGNLTPALLSQLGKYKEDIVAFLQKANRTKSSNLAPIIPVSRNGNISLSFAQQRLWFLNQLVPESAAYNISLAYHLTGSLNVTVLEKSLNKIVQRHEILRTNFPKVESEPYQVIKAYEPFPLPVINLQDLIVEQRNAEVQRLADKEAQQPFDLAQESLFRFKLLLLSNHEYVLLINVHHIICDDWSFKVFFQELKALYETYINNQSSSLPELPIQYVDFAVWQDAWLKEDILQAQLEYWKKQLEGAPLMLQLPTDYPRPTIQHYRGGHKSQKLSKDITDRLNILCQQERVTLFMTLLAAFQTLIYRYSGQVDIIVGTPIANRNHIETEPLIGYFENTLVLRTNLADNPSFRELLKRVREVCCGAYAHQDLPFEKLVEELHPERSLSYNALFQVMFVLENISVTTLNLQGLSCYPLEIDNRTAKYDLLLSMKETEEGVEGEWEYNSDLFDAGTVSQIAGHFQTLVEGIVANPDQHLSELPLLTADERHQLLVEWNQTQVNYPQDKLIHQLFETQAQQTPDAIAVVFEDRQLTYQELNHQANQLAHYLQKLGVGPKVLVGIYLERSLEMVVALMGILKAGGAYVPLDPSYPKDRLAFMLSDSQMPVLVTTKKLLDSLRATETSVVCLNTDWEDITQESVANPVSGVKLEDLAYVLYTSGSTGRPKGVVMRHVSICNLIWWQLQHFTVSVGAKTLQFTPISFDVSFQEIFSTWCSGGTLVLISEELRRDPVALWQFLKEKDINRLFLPFVALQQLAEAAEYSRIIPTSLNEVITAGEQLQITPSITSLFNKIKGCTLHNQYGPTESHIIVTDFTLIGSASSWPLLPPIGRPIGNTQIYILDRDLQPLPIGVPGELHIGGVCLASGYLNRPELTEEKFISNPFSQEPGARLYKTGDLARYLRDGNIEFLGRLDHQVKIRGFRIELGEVESTLAQHSAVQQSVVVDREDVAGHKRLVAYVVSNQEQTPTIDELHHFLKQKLPHYMVPSAFVFLNALPLTPNGKVDRKSLPDPDSSRPALEETFVAPRTLVEQKIADIWTYVLKLEKVGIQDNFFELGGHSLLATQIISRMRQTFSIELPLRVLFEAPTIAKLSSHIEIILWASQELSASESNTIYDYVEIEI